MFAPLGNSRELVDITTKDGADTYLRKNVGLNGDFELFHVGLERAKGLRIKEQKKKKLGGADKQQLCMMYRTVTELAVNADEEVFQENMPKREIALWLDHLIDVLRQKENDPRWIYRGTVFGHDIEQLYAFNALFRHNMPVAMVLEESNLLETISSMIQARKGASRKLPSVAFAQSFIILVGNLRTHASGRFENPWTGEKVFQKFEDPIGTDSSLCRHSWDVPRSGTSQKSNPSRSRMHRFR
mmetsp:Transcript_38478/g.93095  ORF Transcript_38478/g.93095 Transcript_38478/m.93095 type:complete len:242 (+) Transcript_38478:257-982(+)